MTLKGILQKIALLIGSLLFCFLLLEIIFKLIALIQPNQAGPSSIEGLPYENVPNAKFWRYDKEVGFRFYRHNAFGMRGKETTREKPEGVVRVAFLGDSVMHGGNINEEDSTPYQFEEMMAGHNVEALNFGVASYGLKEYLLQLEGKVMDFDPDIVVVGLCLNDYHIHSEQSFDLAQKNTSKSWWRERFDNLKKSHFLDFMKKTTNIDGFSRTFNKKAEILDAESLKRLEGFDYISDDEKEIFKAYCLKNKLPLSLYIGGVVNYLKDYRNPESWERSKDTIQKIIDLCKQNGADVYFFAYPTNEQTLDGFVNSMPQERIRGIVHRCQARYVPLLDTFRAFGKNNPDKKLFPIYDNLHMFREGHRLVAEALAESIDL